MIKVINLDHEITHGFKKQINLCLGFFDGLHKGHLELINEAKEDNYDVGVLTFDGSLKCLIGKRDSEELLTTIEDRKEILNDLNINYLCVLKFTLDVMNMDPIDFINKYLKPLNIHRIFVGNDFTFGKYGKGNVDLLKKYFDVKIVDFVMDKEVKVSTSTIISMIKSGQIERANKLLTRPYCIKGKVEHGLSNGQKLGCRTANVKTDEYVIPKIGVYATYITIDGIKYISMTNIGTHPTIDKLDEISIETYILNFNMDIYNKEVKLEFLEYMRDEKAFDDVKDLILQLSHDKDYILSKYTK